MKRAAVNWGEVRSRLQGSEKGLQEAELASPEFVETVFHKRAIQLAKEHGQDKPAATVSVLIFRLAQEQYAVRLQELSEVLLFRGCTPVPGMAASFLGVINIRGEIRPVIDLGEVLAASSGDKSGFILMLRRQTGLKVDEVEGLREIRAEEVASPIQGHYVRAVDSGTLMLLDVEAMLSEVYSSKES